MVARKIDPARALEMYDDGATDKAIGSALGVHYTTVGEWRRKNGLPRAACNDNRLTATQSRQAKNMLRGGASRAQVSAHLGISFNTVQKIRREMNDAGLRPTGVSGAAIRRSIIDDQTLVQRIERALGPRFPSDLRMEAVNDMYLELLDGKLAISQIEAAAPRFRSRTFEMAGYNFSTRSIDEQDDEGFSLADVIADPNWEAPFDEVLERVFANDD